MPQSNIHDILFYLILSGWISRGWRGCFQKVRTGLPFICLGCSFWPVEMWCTLKSVSNCCTAPLKQNWQLLLAHHDPRIHIRILRWTASVAKVNCFSFLDLRQIPCLLFINWQLLFIKLGDNWQQIKHLSLQNMSKWLNTHPYLVYCWPPLRYLFKLFVISVFHWDQYNWMKFHLSLWNIGYKRTSDSLDERKHISLSSDLLHCWSSRTAAELEAILIVWTVFGSVFLLWKHTNMKRTNYINFSHQYFYLSEEM